MAVQRAVAAPRLDHSIVARSSGLCRKTRDRPNTYSLLTRNLDGRPSLVRSAFTPASPAITRSRIMERSELGKHHGAAGRRRGVETLLIQVEIDAQASRYQPAPCASMGRKRRCWSNTTSSKFKARKFWRGGMRPLAPVRSGPPRGRANGAGGSRGVFATNKTAAARVTHSRALTCRGAIPG